MTAAAPVQPAAPRRGIKALLARYPLLSYSFIAYAGTWLVWLPLLLSEDGLGLMSFSSPLGVLATGGIGTFSGPALAAFIMTGVTEGRAYAVCCAVSCCGGWGCDGICSPSSASRWS
jgi:uncharacterized protein